MIDKAEHSICSKCGGVLEEIENQYQPGDPMADLLESAGLLWPEWSARCTGCGMLVQAIAVDWDKLLPMITSLPLSEEPRPAKGAHWDGEQQQWVSSESEDES